jgi:hypothetical protein
VEPNSDLGVCGLLAKASVAIDGSKFKTVNNRDRNFTTAKMKRRRAQIDKSVARYPAPKIESPAAAIIHDPLYIVSYD